MTGSRDFFIKFWGVRGSIACPGPRTVRYGGNTSCIEVQCDETRVIFDGGTGLRDLGDVLACNPPERIDLFLTHTHHDHVAGVPFSSRRTWPARGWTSGQVTCLPRHPCKRSCGG